MIKEGSNPPSGVQETGASPYEKRERFIVESVAEAGSRIKERFVARLRERFDEGGMVEKLDFHQYRHSAEVGENARKFLEIVKEVDPNLVSETDVILGEVEGLGHDLVQNATKEKGKLRARHRGMAAIAVTPEFAANLDEETRRKLVAGRENDDTLDALAEISNFADGNVKFPIQGLELGNEGASALEILYEMSKYYFPDGTPVFPVADKNFRKGIIEDIAVTLPNFSFEALPDGTKALKVFEPYLSERSSLRALALASADLRGSIGTHQDTASFIKNGRQEFWELNYEMKKDLATGVESVSPDRRAQIGEAIFGWEKTQPGFATWQKILFLERLENNRALNASPRKEDIKAKLAEKLYKPENFDANIDRAKEEAQKLEERFGNSEARAEKFRNLSPEDFALFLKEMDYSA